MEPQKFIIVPKALFSSERYASVPADAKLLYALLLDRRSLSERNGWKDENGCVFLYYPIAEICAAIGCGHGKAAKLMHILERAGLLRRYHCGLGKADMLYVYPPCETVPKSEDKPSENRRTGTPIFGAPERSKSACNNTEKDNTECSDTDTYYGAEAACKAQIEYDILFAEEKYRDYLDAIVSVMTEIQVGISENVRIGQAEYPRAFVRERFRRLDAECVREVLEELLHGEQKILRIKPYLLAALFNIPQTVQAQAAADYHFDFG